ncbi:SNF2 domain-containing protein CLASSY 2-like [Pistacia vera]|uniref:SNF2 domain-containing protein CLASSY 2-like n=1 Tax=Pistacia vera TaxID=55513 RepID=UPI0012632B23|nr:SNF2 domain-containing protein CLASSY 2-like [Pistacia vera]XP_031247879.1 SNF2 domain-containing protein CLASSY 2-like [Pistacia vera]XP_031247886.1 SNF2 domain-containing protein CLASSY 2-like [Pistacia vera]XP_031247892.1 SNF2 domain-containing protein CLASSY 2-like [Pistacia vera]
MPKKRRSNLYQSKHPFDVYPFEAFFHDSWQPVEFIRIEDGIVTMHLTDNQTLVEEKRPFSNLRLKSRRATLSDCTCFLRPGVDVCLLSATENAENSEEENKDPVWLDAKISSIERKPHGDQCLCQFYVKLYVNQGPLGSERGTLSKESKLVGIDQITILQKLGKDACEDQHYRWDFSEDCSLLQRSKLLLGKFSSDLSWLLVASVLKQTPFDIGSVQNKIVYQVLDGDEENSAPNSDKHLYAINFNVDGGISTSHVVQFIQTDTKPVSPDCSVQEAGPVPLCDVMNLRRSKRRNVQPERFFGCDIPPDSDIGWVRQLPYKPDKWKEEDLYLPLPCLVWGHSNCSEENVESDTRNLPKKKSRNKHKEVKTSMASQKEHNTELAIVPVPTESDPLAFYQDDLPAKNPENHSGEIDETPLKYYLKGPRSVQRRDTSELEDTEFERWWGEINPNKKVLSKNISKVEDMGFESRTWGKLSNKKVQTNRFRPRSSKNDACCERKVYKKTTLSAGAYSRVINSYMKNIESTMTNEEPDIIDQWNGFKANSLEQMMEMEQSEMEQTSSEDDGEISENEILWKEMELSMASTYILEDNEGSKSGEPTETLEKSSEGCQHKYRLDEEVGICCIKCGFVRTEIKYVAPPFMQHRIWETDNKVEDQEYSKHKPVEDEGLNIFCNQASSDFSLSEENDNVWALIPELKKKLHFHQKKAFEFLWRNIAGSVEPALMQPASKKTGGCVISHSPGAGKTLLIIAFLVSYLKLFPGKRPLVLAPKTTLYTWYKEFNKWKIPIPVHLIHGRRTYRVFKPKRVKSFRGVPAPTLDVMHVLDCLEKIQKWHAQPSVLVMGYTSFLTLMREDANFAHRKYMAKVLRESPGILILDEGHNPRSTKSRLRKVLMKVETDLRILLSGTLFQNNFCEYFNTLCLARPKFINEVLRELDPKFKRRKNKKKALHLLESRARKFFIDTIARKIDSDNGEERMQGLNMLKNITSGFIDVYEGVGSEELPGLQIYTLMMNPTDVQRNILEQLQDIMKDYNGYPLELELLITLASIHPWLVKTSNCVNKFFTPEALMDLEKYKHDFRKGSKVMFVLNLVYRIVKQEKVLIFCHNIAPINLFSELFQKVFRWQKGKEILVLTGDLELFERGRIMDKFEEPGGPSRVLIASITACAEGISLTAASRVIMLDSEWNPSKTKQAIARAFRPGQQKVVYVYQLLASETLEEDKYRRTTWKEWVSCMIFSEEFVEDPSLWQIEKIEDDILREIVAEDKLKSFRMIMKNEKASKGLIRT